MTAVAQGFLIAGIGLIALGVLNVVGSLAMRDEESSRVDPPLQWHRGGFISLGRKACLGLVCLGGSSLTISLVLFALSH